MIVEHLDHPPADLERRTGWTIKPEGACRGEVCVPLPSPFDTAELAKRLRMALVHDDQHRLWPLGPASGGQTPGSAELPAIVLPDRNGRDFAPRSPRRPKLIRLVCAPG